MDEQNRNLLLATVLSFAVLLIWTSFFMPPVEDPALDPNTPVAEASDGAVPAVSDDSTMPRAEGATPTAVAPAPTATAVADAPRVTFDTPRISGSISLAGGRIDELSLKDYRETLDDESDIVHFLNPTGHEKAYYAAYGWAPGGALTGADVPGLETLWSVESGEALGVDAPVTLRWDAPNDLIFRRTIAIDENYMFQITQSVENVTDAKVSLAPYGMLTREGEPQDLMNLFILHEGAIRQTHEEMTTFNYDDMAELDKLPGWGQADVAEVTDNGWVGFTDHYWQAILVPASDQAFTSVLRFRAGTNEYQAFAQLQTQHVDPGATATVTTQLFAGAKEWATIREYQNEGGINRFLDTIDWGWFFFLTKPIFAVLHWLNAMIGNMGWAIIALTLVLKAILFPLAYRSYVSMAKMKELQPEMEKIKERAGDDRQKLQQEMMEMYRKEKVNPASGCLPILLQIPIFFSLYKVIFVTLELRHAPWFGWITDLAQPDPSSIFNLFGLLPYGVPELGFFEIFSLGILPILLGISMWLQQKLNPAPTDETQKMIFAWMPWVFMFMLGSFASGLVIYWISNNVITFTQQYLIMRSHGAKPDVFGNIRSSFKRGKSKE